VKLEKIDDMDKRLPDQGKYHRDWHKKMDKPHLNILKNILCMLCLYSLINGCAEQDSSYFPLKEGYEWHYNIHASTVGGSEQQKYYLSSLGSQLINDDTTYIQRSLTGTQILFRHSDIGIERVAYLVAKGPQVDLIEDKHLILPNKLEEGMEWESIVSTRTLRNGKPGDVGVNQLRAKVPVKNRIDSINAVIKVPAGKFEHCIKIDTSGFAFNSGNNRIGRTLVEIKESKWFAPGVGLIKSVLTETSTNDAFAKGEIIMELESFTKP
jgi:hypothetical protein